MHALIGILTLSFCLHAESADWFDQGLKTYQAKQFDQARENFEKALTNRPNDAAVLYNLGLAYFQLNKKGYAVGYWRKALTAAPGLSGPAAALDRVEDKFHFSHLEKTPWEQAIHSAYQHLGWNSWLLMLAVFFTAAGWQLLNFFQKRKLAMRDENEEAPSAGLGLILLSLLAIASIVAAGGKLLDATKHRGTVVTTTAELRAAPADDGVTLAPVSEASEIAIVQTHGDWVQVTTGDGATGWLKKTDVLSANKDI